MAYLLRVALPDIPGSLGRLASAIGDAGGDIQAIEIVEHRADGSAVDDVLLETPLGTMPDSIVSACRELPGVEVLWISRYGAGGNLFLDLEAVETLTETPEAALDRLVDLLPATFRADWAARVSVGDGGVKLLAATSAAPELGQDLAQWFPLRHAVRAEWPGPTETSATELVGLAALGSEYEGVLIGRRGGPEVLDSELARLQHLAALAVTISGSAH